MENLPPSNAIFYGVTITLLIIAAGLVTFNKLFVRKPSIDAEFATKAELRELEKDMDARFDKLDTSLDTKLAVLDAKRSRQVAQLHEDIRSVDAKVERILGRLDKD